MSFPFLVIRVCGVEKAQQALQVSYERCWTLLL
jgi:hypothetical protein